MKRVALVAVIALAGCAGIPTNAPDRATYWLTTADETHKLERQADVIATATPDAPNVVVDTAQTFQTIQGFGAAITDASAELIAGMPDDKRRALLHELFGRDGDGIGLSFTRLTVGASDFSRTHYSYDDTPGNVADPDLRYFSIAPAKQHVLPVTREALRINRDLAVMITPWSAPAWMKTSNSLIKGRLKPEAGHAFAAYLGKTVRAFEREGVPVALLSIQNEPDFEPDNYPGMRMSAAERAQVIADHVGPVFAAMKLTTKILDWDHNWDKPDQPLGVLGDARANRYVSGVAWHCYGGDVTAQEQVRAAHPDKEVWFTECSGGEWAPKFGETLGWMTSKLIIASSNSGSKGTSLWNLALDPAHGPHLGGCGDCRGVVTVDPKTGTVSRNVEYYVLGHASRFVRTGAKRVATSSSGGVEATAFINPDRSLAMILYRPDKAAVPVILLDGRSYRVDMPIGAVATITWPRSGR